MLTRKLFCGDDAFIWGNSKKQPAYPTDDEWKHCVQSNVDELNKQLKTYNIQITETKVLRNKRRSISN